MIKYGQGFLGGKNKMENKIVYMAGFPRKKKCKICNKVFLATNPRHTYCGNRKKKLGCRYKKDLELNRKHHKIRKQKGYYKTKVMREKLRKQKRRYKDSHLEYVKRQRILNNEYCKKNRKILYKKNKEWRRNNLVLILLKNRERKLRLEGVKGSHTIKEWTELKRKHNFCCVKCGISEKQLKERWNDINKGFIKLTRDHIIPIFLNGTDYIENIQPLCISCNAEKGVKI